MSFCRLRIIIITRLFYKQYIKMQQVILFLYKQKQSPATNCEALFGLYCHNKLCSRLTVFVLAAIPFLYHKESYNKRENQINDAQDEIYLQYRILHSVRQSVRNRKDKVVCRNHIKRQYKYRHNKPCHIASGVVQSSDNCAD